MANRYYGCDFGADQKEDVTEAATTNSSNIELFVTYTATGADKDKLIRAIDAIRMYILDDTFPPA